MSELAGHRLVDFADISIGYKSLLNDFFYLDVERIREFAIEKEYLTPIYKLSDLTQDSYFQHGLPRTRWVFTCKKDLRDLTGTGALAYIKWGARQETRPRRQSKEQPVRWSEAPALNPKHWYWPAARVWKTRIAIRKAFGQRYAPFLFQRASLLDQRLYLVLPKTGVDSDLIAAYLSSSLFPLALETNANLSLGVGYLTLGTNALRRLPCIDLNAIANSKSRDRILEAAEAAWEGPPPDAGEYPANKRITPLDRAFLAAVGVPESRRGQLANQVAHFSAVRQQLEKLKEGAPSAASRRDVDEVAHNIAQDLERWLSGRRFPEDSYRGKARMRISIPADSLVVRTEPMMTECRLQVLDVHGAVLLDSTYPLPVAEVILRALQLGRREFEAPEFEGVADKALKDFASLRSEIDDEFLKMFATTSLGSKYEASVRDAVSRITGLVPEALAIPMGHAEWLLERGAS